MGHAPSEVRLKTRCVFAVSSVYEVFYAMNVCLDPQPPVHRTWAERARRLLAARCPEDYAAAGDAFLWTALPDTLGVINPNATFDALREALLAVPAEQFSFRLFEGVFHDEAVAHGLATDRITMEQAIVRSPEAKREWLAYLGLYPYDPHHSTTRMLVNLRRDVVAFRMHVARLLDTFWRDVFNVTWHHLQAGFERAAHEREELFTTVSLPEFLARCAVPIEANVYDGHLKAIRGGYTAPFDAIERLYFLPSAFNWRHLWSAINGRGARVTAYVPMFEPHITTEDLRAPVPSAPALDPALVFKALGDPTRYALAVAIAKRDMTSAELARHLGVSRATITHHVHVMRAASLIEDPPGQVSRRLRLQQRTIARLSEMALKGFFGDPPRSQAARDRGNYEA